MPGSVPYQRRNGAKLEGQLEQLEHFAWRRLGEIVASPRAALELIEPRREIVHLVGRE
jgi:hypothetical protein